MSEHAPANPWDRRLGFWWIAEDHPDDPGDHREPRRARTYGELAGDAHQLVHLFRSLGAAQRRRRRRARRQRQHADRGVARQPGGRLPLHPAEHPSHRAELAAIMEHSGAKVLVIGARFAPLLARPRHGSARPARCSPIGDIDGCRHSPTHAPAHPRTEPPDRSPGGLFVYTSGTTGKPKGIRRPIPDRRRRPGRQRRRRVRPGVRLPPVRGPDAGVDRHVPRRLAQLLHGRAARRPRAGDHGEVRSRADAAADRAAPGPHRLHGADPVPPPARSSPRTSATSTTCRACTPSSTPLPRARGRSRSR